MDAENQANNRSFPLQRESLGETRYVLITPMRDEERHIETTIRSVLSQTLKPVKWVIVDDGSTDRSPEVVSKYLKPFEFIRLLRLEKTGSRNFGSKAAAFNAGLKLLEDVPYAFVGNLDADTSVAPDYYGNMLAEFKGDPDLGIAGGIVFTKIGGRFYTDDTTLDSVGGAIQLFRRECFEQIGGYLPLPHGGIDAAAEIMARMKGWTVRKFPENKVWEQRRTGSAGNGLWSSMYKLGMRFHTLGYSTSFFLLRSVYRAKNKPFLLGSGLTLLGFLSARMRGYPVSLPAEAVAYLKAEQTKKLRDLFLGRASRDATPGKRARVETT